MRALLIAISSVALVSGAPALAQSPKPFSDLSDLRKVKSTDPLDQFAPRCAHEMEMNGSGTTISAMLIVCSSKADRDAAAAAIPLVAGKLVGKNEDGKRDWEKQVTYRWRIAPDRGSRAVQSPAAP